MRRIYRIPVIAALLGAVAITPVGGEPAHAGVSGDYRPLTPARILDTRDGTGAPQAPVGADQAIVVDVTGVGGVPSTGVGAVVLNLTGTNPTEATFVTAFPTGGSRDGSNLNLLRGQTDSNLVVARVADDGTISVYNRFGTVDLLADVAGWFPEGDAYHPLAPARILDTRDGTGAPAAPVAADTAIDLDVTGVGGVPESGVGAVVLNVTGTQPTAATFISAFPTGGAREGSNLNLLPGQTDASLVIATVGVDGHVSLYNRFGTTHLIADVAGWFPAGGTYQPLSPARILDTRDGTGAPAAPVGDDTALDLQVTGVGGVPASGVGAVVLNVTVTQPTAATFVAAYPTGTDRQGSNVNLLPNQTTSNLVVAAVGEDGRVSLYNRFGTAHLIADVAGWFPGAPVPTGGPLLYATGNSTLWKWDPEILDPNTGEPYWQDLNFSHDALDVDAAANELIVVDHDPIANETRVAVRRLDTFQTKETFLWPSTWNRLDQVEASPDGRYLALSGVDYSQVAWLEILDRATKQTVYVSDFLADEGTALFDHEWMPDGDLLVSLDLRDNDELADVGGLLVRFDGTTLEDDTQSIEVLQESTQPDGPMGGLAVSPSGDRIAYSQLRQLWTVAATPGAAPLVVATGPDVITGAQFSPDGTALAAVRIVGTWVSPFNAQYILPAAPPEPILIDDHNGDEYQFSGDDTPRRGALIVDIIEWIG